MCLNNVYHGIDLGFVENSLYLKIVVKSCCPLTHGSADRISAFGLEGKFFESLEHTLTWLFKILKELQQKWEN